MSQQVCHDKDPSLSKAQSTENRAIFSTAWQLGLRPHVIFSVQFYEACEFSVQYCVYEVTCCVSVKMPMYKTRKQPFNLFGQCHFWGVWYMYSRSLYSLTVGFTEHVRFMQRLPDLSWPGCFDYQTVYRTTQSGTDQWDWRVVYEFYTLAFRHHNTWPHTQNSHARTINLTITARKIHMYF
jgi:hypothetical protein